MSRRRETKQQHRVAIMEKRRKIEEKTEKIIQERVQRALQIEEMQKKILESMKVNEVPSEETAPIETNDVTEEEIPLSEVEVV